MSKFLKIDNYDIFKGFIMILLGSVLGTITQIVNLGRFPEPHEWKSAFMFGLGAGMTYLVKNLFTNSEGEFAEHEKTNSKN